MIKKEKSLQKRILYSNSLQISTQRPVASSKIEEMEKAH